jgi:hypothetical protein
MIPSPQRSARRSGLRALLGLLLLSLAPAAQATSASPLGRVLPGPIAAPITAPLVAFAKNPNYFQDATGTPIALCGSHSWNTLQDWGTNGTPQTLDWNAFVSFLTSHGHNFTLLWRSELPKFSGLPTVATSPPDFTVSSHPWMRTGPGNATDGHLKFDLSKFDQTFFDRLRSRVQALGSAGIYAGVYLFTGEWIKSFRSSTDGYPFSGANNVNGIADDGAMSSITMTATNSITAIQDAFVRKCVDTLNDLPNTLWIVSEEAPTGSEWWNNHVISTLRTYEATKPAQHPIGYAAPDAGDTVLYDSNADWVAPQARQSPTQTSGTGTPARKVNVNDSDHSYFGMWNDSAQTNRNYAWENFAGGNQVLFMDPYVVYYPRENRNLCPNPVDGIGSGPDPRWNNFRDNLGYILTYSRKVNLANVTPQGSLSSTGWCLAQTPAVGAEYLVYAPTGGTFTVNLAAMPATRNVSVEWFNPSTGATTAGSPVAAGASRSFTPPFGGDAVLYLVDTAGHAGAPPPAPTVAQPAAASPNPATGTTAALSALGADSGGEASLTYTWSASGPAAVTFSPNGTNAAKNTTATFSAAGAYTLTVTLRNPGGGSTTSSTPVTVDQTATSVVVSPSSVSVVESGTQQFTASEKDQFGHAMASQPSFTWSVSGGGTMSASGLFSAGTTPGGPFTVTAIASGHSGVASVTVTLSPPVLTSIQVSPASASVAPGGTEQFTAHAIDQFGNPMNPPPAFGWSTSGGGTIDAAGLFTAGGTAGGPFTVTASSGAVHGAAMVTVAVVSGATPGSSGSHKRKCGATGGEAIVILGVLSALHRRKATLHRLLR